MGLFKDIVNVVAGNTDEVEWWDKIGAGASEPEMPLIPAPPPPPAIRLPSPLVIISQPYGDRPETIH